MADKEAAPPPPGVYVPVPTFFVSKSAPNYSSEAPPLDLETQAKHAIHLAKSGIRGLVLLGSTGEAVAMTSKERSQLLKHVRAELDKADFKDYPIVAGTNTQGVEDTVQQLKDAKDAGAQFGLVLAPGYFAMALNQAGLKDWYTAIAERSPIPIMMYVRPLLLQPSTTSSTIHNPSFRYVIMQSGHGSTRQSADKIKLPLPCSLEQHHHHGINIPSLSCPPQHW